MKLVIQTMKAMTTIANYYMDNPIKKKVIKQAKRYKNVLKPFGNAIEHLSKLKKLGTIPMKLVQQTLNAFSSILNFYREQSDNSFDEIDTRRTAISISGVVSSFGKSVESLKSFKGLQGIQINLISNIIESTSKILSFYNDTVLSNDGESKSKIIEHLIGNFTSLTTNMQNAFVDISNINTNLQITFTSKN